LILGILEISLGPIGCLCGGGLNDLLEARGIKMPVTLFVCFVFFAVISVARCFVSDPFFAFWLAGAGYLLEGS
jgi:hypothetical protein